MKFAAATLLALPLLAVATPLEARQDRDCDPGSLQCCESTTSSTSPTAGAIAGLLGIVVGDLTGLLGLGCSPLSIIGVGSGDACTSSPVCCSNTELGGLIGIGCAPITL